ncbi:hypothetical protein E8E11_004164 [Didymella keratinophila]|nr:hypothetical protein E8E11_004164 [Didymella keratinophila]
MLFSLSALVAAIAASTALAAPAMDRLKKEPHLEDIQCRCLTFRANERPTPCNFFESKGFGWRSAQILASQYDIKVQFASKNTISRVLAIPAPLPSEILDTTSKGDALSESSDENISQNKIVCGFGREVRHMTHHHLNVDPESRYVGQVIAWITLFIILYAAGEYVWIKYTSRRPIKLKGEEKPIKARPSIVMSEKDSPSDFS